MATLLAQTDLDEQRRREVAFHAGVRMPQPAPDGGHAVRTRAAPRRWCPRGSRGSDASCVGAEWRAHGLVRSATWDPEGHLVLVEVPHALIELRE